MIEISVASLAAAILIPMALTWFVASWVTGCIYDASIEKIREIYRTSIKDVQSVYAKSLPRDGA